MHLLAQSAVLKALGWSLFHSLWQMALLWLAYVIFTQTFRRASANVRHGLAILLLSSGVVWTITTFFQALLYADPAASVYGWGVALFPQTYWFNSFLHAGRQWINDGLPYCSTLYLLILLFLFVRYARQYFYSKRLFHTGLSRPAPEMRTFTAKTARQMGIRKEVKIWFSRLVEGPVTLGSLKPVILIPLATAANLSTQQVEALILHELAHIQKQDYLLHLWIAALDALFFFNPFSTLLIKSIQKEREHRCDDLVLQFRYDPHAYVSALMTLAKATHSTPRLALAAAGSNDGLLLQRVKRILKLQSSPEPLKGRPLLFLCCTVFIAGMALTRPAIKMVREKIEETVYVAATPSKDKSAGSAPEVGTVDIINAPARGNHAEGKTSRKKPAPARENEKDVNEADDQDIIQADGADDEEGALVGYASSIQPRDYSITAHSTSISPKVEVIPAPQPTNEGCPLQAPAPYVPNSSFSFQRIQDSTLPGAQYVYMQQMASHQVEQAIVKLQKELHWQLRILQQSSTKEIPDLKQKQQIILDQLKLQEQYLEKQQQLQKKLEKIGKKRVIVVI
jgi:hypothetical protein